MARGCALPPPGKAGLSDAGCLEKGELCERAAVARQRLTTAATAAELDVEDVEALAGPQGGRQLGSMH